MSKLLSVFKSTSEKVIIARRDIYALLMLLIISATTLIFIEPLNTTVFKYFESTYSHIGIEKM